jgi:cytochrome oxidase Cu insertion factor (SCO1/SenC/PrrC family)
MIRWVFRYPLIAALTALLASVVVSDVLFYYRLKPNNQDLPVAEGPDDFGAVGDFAFTERTGQAVNQDTLHGKVWIAACFFTCCTESCPQLSGALARLQGELAAQPDVRLVSITVDPSRDTTEVLTRYAGTYNADADRWLFLTGSEDEVRRFVRERLKLAAEPNPGAPDGSRVLHSPKLTLIDKRGRISGYFDGTDPAAVGRLKTAAERLAREAP